MEPSLREMGELGEARLPLDRIPLYLAVCYTLAIVLSAIHEYAYFLVIGIQYFNILSVYDFAKLAIHWLPGVSLGSAIYILALYSIMRKLRIIDMYKSGKRTSIIYRYLTSPPMPLAISVGILAIVLGTLVDTNHGALLISVGVLYLILPFMQSIKDLAIRTDNPNTLFAAVAGLSTIITVIVVMFFGFLSGYWDRDSNKYNDLIHFTVGGDEMASILRLVDSGIVVKLPNDTIRYYRWPEIRYIENKIIGAKHS